MIPEGADFVWAAFWSLHGDRQHTVVGFAVPLGMTMIMPKPGRIPFTAIDAYARRYQIAGDAFDVLVALLDLLDSAYLAWEGERMRDQMTQAST